MRVALGIAWAVAALGCSSPAHPADASDPGPCWPDTLGTPHGAAVLGTGRDAFAAMPAVLPLEYGGQGGFDLVANVRMSGFAPGNLQDLLDPGNPRTRIRAFFADTNVPLNYYAKCPFRTGYMPSGVSDYDYQLPAGVPIVFETCWRSDRLIGARIRIELELLDRAGNYTTDQKIVTAAAPTTPYPPESGTPGCQHVASDP
jgi:hypothetical protein